MAKTPAETIKVRVPSYLMPRLRSAAKRAGLPLSTWIRAQAVAAAKVVR